MYFKLCMFGIWIAYVTSNEHKIEYTIDSERAQESHVISFHDDRREKRQVENSWSSSTTAHSNISIKPTTQTIKPTPNISSILPSTTKMPSTTRLKSTTKAPNTTRLPSTTMAPNTPRLPSTTKAPSTTRLPSTTKAPSTTRLPSTTIAQSTSKLPSTTKTPSTTRLPSTPIAPSTSKLPSTTKSPSTTRKSPTTKAPSRTTEGLSTATTTVSKETTFNPPQTTYVKQSNTHQYYNSTVIHDGNGVYWDELENHTTHVVLSNAKYLSSAGLELPFTMPFYGHNISKVQLTTGGFIYMAPFVHKFLTYSQYVAPLMANFDTQTNNSDILYKKYNDSVVIEWRNLHLNDQRYHGQFRFQAKLFQNGSIMLVYKTIPAPVMNISTDNHPVKLGISDAFYMDYTQNGIRYRRIYKYHAVDIEKSLVTNNTVVIFHPLPTCNQATSCDHCISRDIDFDCSWCPSVGRCSNGLDWYRQEWSESECLAKAGNTSDICRVTTVASTTKLTTTKPQITTRIPSTSTPPSTTSPPKTTTMPPSTPNPTTTEASTAIPTTPATTSTQVTTTPSTPSTPTTLPSSTKATTTPTTTTPTTTKPTTTKPTTTKPTTTPTTSSPATSKPTTTKPTTFQPTNTQPTSTKSTTTPSSTVSSTTLSSSNQPQVQRNTQGKESSNKAAVVVPIVLFLLLIVGLVGGWVYYAYTHPNTSAGQWLIEHRPSQLKSRFSDMFKRSTETGEKYKVKNEDIEFNMDDNMDESVA
ncbi:uncharacterized protein LOC134706356 [Mytilus trossulus]|uniref:uncharacterized protein LOC134706356 n=1 Tax=Mytilus trossulus TaxID=6551 RepID=UPI003004BEA6